MLYTKKQEVHLDRNLISPSQQETDNNRKCNDMTIHVYCIANF